MNVIRTPRLILREFEDTDDTFILSLLNEPGFLRYIGDKGVRTAADARCYIEQGPRESYVRHGYGLYATCIPDGTPVGMCGLVRRQGLAHADLGFAFLSRVWGQGYACESASAVLAHAFGPLGLPKVLAITALENQASIAVLGKVGLQFERLIQLRPEGEPLRLYAIDAPGP